MCRCQISRLASAYYVRGLTPPTPLVTTMPRRPVLVASVAIVLFLVYCLNFLGTPRVGQTADSWSRPWRASTDNAPDSGLAAAPALEDVVQPASPIYPDSGLAAAPALEDVVKPASPIYPDSGLAAVAAPEVVEKPASPTDALPLGINTPNEHDNLIDTLGDGLGSSHLDEVVYPFMGDVTYPQPSLDLSTLAHFRPHNLASSGAHPTYATYLSSRNTSLHDPYFVATQQIVYRTLWSPTIASAKYPFTVFVAPFIPNEQRNILAGGRCKCRGTPPCRMETNRGHLCTVERPLQQNTYVESDPI